MKKSIFLLIATLILVATGCNKENIITDEIQYVTELKVNFESDTKVSTTHSNTGLKFAWENGDVIEVWEDKNTSALTKHFVYDASANSFKPQSDSDKLEVGKSYFAVTSSTWYYISVSDDKSVVPMELKGGTGLAKVPMITDVFEATEENTMATMHHIVGVVEVPVKGAVTGSKLQILTLNSQTANQALRGDLDISPISPYTFTSTNGYFDSSNQTSTDTPIDLSTSEAKSIFIPAFPGTYSTIDIKYTLVGKGEVTVNTNHQLVVERGKITKISEFTLE